MIIGVVIEAVECGLRDRVGVDFKEVQKQYDTISLVVLPPDYLYYVLHNQVEQLRPLRIMLGDKTWVRKGLLSMWRKGK